VNTESSNAKRFLHAAQLAELKTLEQLANNCSLVNAVCNLVHELQKERGVSNVYLASVGTHYSIRRVEQIKQSQAMQAQFMQILDKHYIESTSNTNNHRLLFCISQTFSGLDELTKLRLAIEKHEIKAKESTQSFCRLISSLITIIFEAADVANEESISKSLIALINFIQGKEYAGQERAWGSIGFAETTFSPDLCQRLLDLQALQSESFRVFTEYATPIQLEAWETLSAHSVATEISKLRELIQNLAQGHAIASQISEVWYELYTQRIDQMHEIECLLSQHLLSLAQAQVMHIKQEMSQYKKNGYANLDLAKAFPSIPSILFNSNTEGAEQTASLRQKSLYDLLSKQTERINEMSEQLFVAEQNLKEHKTLNRAKLLLIQQLNISEQSAHNKLQHAEMNQNKRA